MVCSWEQEVGLMCILRRAVIFLAVAQSPGSSSAVSWCYLKVGEVVIEISVIIEFCSVGS